MTHLYLLPSVFTCSFLEEYVLIGYIKSVSVLSWFVDPITEAHRVGSVGPFYTRYIWGLFWPLHFHLLIEIMLRPALLPIYLKWQILKS